MEKETRKVEWRQASNAQLCSSLGTAYLKLCGRGWYRAAGIAGGGSGEGDKEGGVAAGDFEASNAVGECAAQPASARRSAINTMGLFCVQMRACATFIATMRRLVLFAQCSSRLDTHLRRKVDLE